MKAVQLIAAIALLASAAAADAQMVVRAPVIRTPSVILPPPPPPPVRVTPLPPQLAPPQCFDIVERDGPVYRTRTLCTR